jgi:methionyl aminopeptidase
LRNLIATRTNTRTIAAIIIPFIRSVFLAFFASAESPVVVSSFFSVSVLVSDSFEEVSLEEVSVEVSADVSSVDKKNLWAKLTEASELVANAVVGNRLGDIGSAVEEYNKSCGFSVVREFVGHGIGRDVHEDPNVPNYGTPGRGVRLMNGMTIAVEPMVCAGSAKVKVLSDKWTVVTCDGSLSAHYEHTVAITEEGPILLTKID